MIVTIQLRIETKNVTKVKKKKKKKKPYTACLKSVASRNAPTQRNNFINSLLFACLYDFTDSFISFDMSFVSSYLLLSTSRLEMFD